MPAHLGSGLGIPDDHAIVTRPAGDVRIVWRERDRVNVLRVPHQRAQLQSPHIQDATMLFTTAFPPESTVRILASQSAPTMASHLASGCGVPDRHVSVTRPADDTRPCRRESYREHAVPMTRHCAHLPIKHIYVRLLPKQVLRGMTDANTAITSPASTYSQSCTPRLLPLPERDTQSMPPPPFPAFPHHPQRTPPKGSHLDSGLVVPDLHELVLRSDPLAMRVPSSENATASTSPAWPVIVHAWFTMTGTGPSGVLMQMHPSLQL